MKNTLPEGDTDEETLKLVEVTELAQDPRRQFPRWVSVRQLCNLQTKNQRGSVGIRKYFSWIRIRGVVTCFLYYGSGSRRPINDKSYLDLILPHKKVCYQIGSKFLNFFKSLIKSKSGAGSVTRML
jgi:hypothetical protein